MHLKMNKPPNTLLYSLVLILLISFQQLIAQSKQEVLEKIWEGLGGEASWDEARYFMFSCNTNLHDFTTGEHAYIWDRQTGACRFEGQTDDDQKLIVLFNQKKRTGGVYVNGKKITGEFAKKILENVFSAFDTDAFWLFIPDRIADPNDIEVEPAELIGNKRFYVVKIPAPPFFAEAHSSKLFLDTKTGLPYQWTVVSHDKDNLYTFRVTGFKDVGGGLTLAASLTTETEKTIISYPLVSALINVEANKFTEP